MRNATATIDSPNRLLLKPVKPEADVVDITAGVDTFASS